MKQKKRFTLEEHLEAAELLLNIRADLMRSIRFVSEGTGANKPHTRDLIKMYNLLDQVRSDLDDEWADDCTPDTPEGNATHSKYGHIYYN